MRENTLVDKIFKYLKTLDNCFSWKNHGNQYSRIGLPDIVAVWKGKIYCFETKVEGNKPTLLQQATIKKLKEAGAIAEVVYSLEEVKELMK
jgi:hypothetical protein